MANQAPTVVVTDANVLINFVHVGRLDLLGLLAELAFVIPKEVTAEITDPGQRAAVQAAVDSGHLTEVRITDQHEIERFADLNTRFGKGESACLTLAESRGWRLACDERRAFRRTVVSTIGEAHLLTTPDLIVRAIRDGLTTVEEADHWKAVLAERRFKMKFDSFADII